MKNKLLIIILTLSLPLFSGCQLAKIDTVYKGPGKLIGCFVTTEYIDTFDFEQYISDNPSKLGKGNIIIDNNQSGYDQKIYATMKKTTSTSQEGETFPEIIWDFANIKGYYYLAPTLEINGEKTIYSCQSENIGDVHTKVNVTDDSENIDINATLYVLSTSNDLTFYANPVYQNPDGDVYLLSGSGLSTNETFDEGPLMSTTLKDETSSNFNQEIKTSTNEITLSIEVMFPLKKSTILEMDKNNQLIKQTPIDLQNIPKDFIPTKDTQYIILENIKTDPHNKDYQSVQSYDKQKNSLDLFSDNGQGILNKHTLNLLWE